MMGACCGDGALAREHAFEIQKETQVCCSAGLSLPASWCPGPSVTCKCLQRASPSALKGLRADPHLVCGCNLPLSQAHDWRWDSSTGGPLGSCRHLPTASACKALPHWPSAPHGAGANGVQHGGHSPSCLSTCAIKRFFSGAPAQPWKAQVQVLTLQNLFKCGQLTHSTPWQTALQPWIWQ